jgi:hypothetical protein
LLTADFGQATSHVFVRNSEGVWLASDSLVIHNDGKQVTSSKQCKVAISRGQLFFNTGFFKDMKLLRSQESALPFANMAATEASVNELLKTNHMDMSNDPKHTPDQLVVNAGILHGFGDAVNRVRDAAGKDPVLATRIAKNPKQELLKVLEEEAIMRNGEVEGPFTVLLLHNDGTVSDYSDQHLCVIPESALHIEENRSAPAK